MKMKTTTTTTTEAVAHIIIIVISSACIQVSLSCFRWHAHIHKSYATNWFQAKKLNDPSNYTFYTSPKINVMLYSSPFHSNWHSVSVSVRFVLYRFFLNCSSHCSVVCCSPAAYFVMWFRFQTNQIKMLAFFEQQITVAPLVFNTKPNIENVV